MQLDPKQQEAVLHAEGPAIVVAGPGSGKTAVLTHRIDHLIKQLHIPPEKIMVITFARAAAEEMKSRFQAFPGEADAPVYFATFHAAFYKILRREEGLPAGSVLGGEERLSWLKDLLTRENAEAEKQEDILHKRRRYVEPGMQQVCEGQEIQPDPRHHDRIRYVHEVHGRLLSGHQGLGSGSYRMVEHAPAHRRRRQCC